MIGQLLIYEELITKDNVSEEEEEVNEEDDKDKKEEDSVTTATFDAEESSTTKDTFTADVDEEIKPEEDEEEEEETDIYPQQQREQQQQQQAEVDLLQRIKQEEARIKRKIAERRDVIVAAKLENSKKKADEWYRYINDEAPQLSQPALSSPPSTPRQATSSYVTNLQ